MKWNSRKLIIDCRKYEKTRPGLCLRKIGRPGWSLPRSIWTGQLRNGVTSFGLTRESSICMDLMGYSIFDVQLLKDMGAEMSWFGVHSVFVELVLSIMWKALWRARVIKIYWTMYSFFGLAKHTEEASFCSRITIQNTLPVLSRLTSATKDGMFWSSPVIARI